MRSSQHRGGRDNKGLVLVFETGEELGLVQQLLERHRHNIFLDTVKGVGCLDHYMAAGARAGRRASAESPAFQYQVGRGGLWTSQVTTGAGKVAVEGESGAECLYKVVQALLGGARPEYNNFIRWRCYPSFSAEVNTMAGARLEHIMEMLPLQNHLQRSLKQNRVPLNMEVRTVLLYIAHL